MPEQREFYLSAEVVLATNPYYLPALTSGHDRVRHERLDAHFGTFSATQVDLSAAIGPLTPGFTYLGVHYGHTLEDELRLLHERLTARESAQGGHFSLNAGVDSDVPTQHIFWGIAYVTDWFWYLRPHMRVAFTQDVSYYSSAWAQVILPWASHVVIDTLNSNYDTFLFILDSNQNIVASNNNTPTTPQSLIDIVLPDGTYYIQVYKQDNVWPRILELAMTLVAIETFSLDALSAIRLTGSMALDAFVAGIFTLDAWIHDTTGSLTLDAWVLDEELLGDFDLGLDQPGG